MTLVFGEILILIVGLALVFLALYGFSSVSFAKIVKSYKDKLKKDNKKINNLLKK